MIIKQVTRPTTSEEADCIDVVVKAENALVQGDVVQWSDTNSAAYPLGVAVEDSVADVPRVAGVVVSPTVAAGEYGLVRVYGYCKNITTDGNVAGTDLYLVSGAAIAVGATAAEVNADITTADFNSLRGVFAWNIVADAGTVGEGFIQCMGS